MAISTLSQDEEVFASKMVYHHGQVIAALLCSDIKAGRLAAQKVIVKVKGLFIYFNKSFKSRVNETKDIK